jgi:hypothetical protein
MPARASSIRATFQLLSVQHEEKALYLFGIPVLANGSGDSSWNAPLLTCTPIRFNRILVAQRFTTALARVFLRVN